MNTFVLKSLSDIEKVKNNHMYILKEEKWLKYIALSSEHNVNRERFNSFEEIENNYVLNYVSKTLKMLCSMELDEYQTYIIAETLKWSEVAKGGLKNQRNRWIRKGYNLFAHNVGSAQIYLEESLEPNKDVKDIVYHLILTHGLLGQYIRGEVPLSSSKPLYELVQSEKISTEALREILWALNYCIISAADENIWLEINSQMGEVIESLLYGEFCKQYDLKDRMRRLRAISIKNGENFDVEYDKFLSERRVVRKISKLFETVDLWYVEAALYDFSFEEFIKIFLIISCEFEDEPINHVSFEELMKTIYYEREGKKRINLYMKRIIERYLSNITIEDILDQHYREIQNPHVNYSFTRVQTLEGIGFFNFHFSSAGGKLIEFCIEAEKSDVLYENAIILLFDLFELRKDQYDRFYEEERYLSTMNQAIDYKKVLLDYMIGEKIIDIGPGGGALMDVIEERYPNKKIIGVDISQNVIDNLKKKKMIENKNWDVIYGDALNLGEYIPKGSVDTIIFCSILHELFSYIEYNGKKFNHETLKAVFKSTFDILPIGGRIIIRDGIMTENIEEKRIIRFLSEEGMHFLARYVKDFKGRNIEYQVIGHNEVMMTVNDAMEFLYTYTWGEKSYVHEVNEQFGYFTPNGYKEFIEKNLGKGARIIEMKHFLQEGYTIALAQKIEFLDEERNSTKLPDSTCIIVIEKVGSE